ncbi:MAG: exodeoxyribonuclease V subunit alpha, partial [Acidimicrobiales bacterium]
MTVTEGLEAAGPAPSDGDGVDPFNVRLARRAGGILRDFNLAGVLSAADVHVALRLARLGGDEGDEGFLLAAALAVRAPRLGHVCVDLASIAGTVAVDADVALDTAVLAWPEPRLWLEGLAASPLVAGEEGGDHRAHGESRPLRLAGTRLYLDRYWREECQVATDLRDRSEGGAAGVDMAVL